MRVGMAMLLVALLPASVRADGPARVLPADTSPVVREWLDRSETDAGVPEGWKVAGVETGADEITIDLEGPGAAWAEVRLLPAGAPETLPGRWFGIAVASTPGLAEGDALVALGRALDAAFEEDPWVLPRDAQSNPSPGASESFATRQDGPRFSRHAVAAIGLVNILFLGALVAWALVLGLRDERQEIG